MEFISKFVPYGQPGKEAASEKLRVGVAAAIGSAQLSALSALLPGVSFETLQIGWPESYGQLDVLIAEVDADLPGSLTEATRRLRALPSSLRVIVIMHNADVSNTRLVAHSGAADVLPAPVGDAAFMLSLERLLVKDKSDQPRLRRTGQVTVMLKAGGGVGATSLGAELVNRLAGNVANPNQICFADLDLQFGAAALYFDLGEALTISDCIAVGDLLHDTQFGRALATHGSGVKVLAGATDPLPLDVLSPQTIDALLGALKRDFALTVVDLPSVWTEWSNRAVELADRIILVTHLTVPHVHLVRRQLKLLAQQKLDHLPLILVCNAVTAEQRNMLSLKAAEAAIGREFNFVIPADQRFMQRTSNEGVGLFSGWATNKFGKVLDDLAGAIAGDAFVDAASAKGR